MGKDSRLKWQRRVQKILTWKAQGKGALCEQLLRNINKKQKLYDTFEAYTEAVNG